MSLWHGTAKSPAGLVYFVFDESDQQLISARFDPSHIKGPARKSSPIHKAFAQYVIVIPCHRVVASNGVGGYGYGVDTKVKLLVHEGAEGY